MNQFEQHPKWEYEEKTVSVRDFLMEYGSRNIPFAVAGWEEDCNKMEVVMVAERFHELQDGSRKYTITITDAKENIFSLFGCESEGELFKLFTDYPSRLSVGQGLF